MEQRPRLRTATRERTPVTAVFVAMPPTGTDLTGRIVLVKSSADRHHPPVAQRSTIVRREATASGPRLVLELEFPQMFERPAHRRTVVLDAPAVERLLASENNGRTRSKFPRNWTSPVPADDGPEPRAFSLSAGSVRALTGAEN